MTDIKDEGVTGSIIDDMQGFINTLHVECDDEQSNELLNDFIAQLDDTRVAQCLMQIFGMFLDTGLGNPEAKKAYNALAIESASVMGPDHAQTMYHFAKLVTKLA